MKQQPQVKEWMAKHPRMVHFFVQRTSTERFFGLANTFLVVLFGVCFFILTSLIQDYLAQDPLIAADVRLANILLAYRTQPGLHLMYAVTLLASSASVVLGLGGATLVLFCRKQWRLAMVVLAGLVATEGCTAVAKILFHRLRPGGIIQAVVEDSFSFPSGHATSAVFYFGLLAYVLMRSFSGKRWHKVLIGLCTIFLIVNVDFSRLYLGVHYLSDVLAGSMVGFLGLIATIWFIEYGRLQKKLPAVSASLAHVAVGVALVLSFLFSFYTYYFGEQPWIAALTTEEKIVDVSAVAGLFIDNTLPHTSESIDGRALEPVSLLLIAPESCLASNLEKAGWTQAEVLLPSTVWKAAWAAITNSPYISAPMTPAFYQYRPHDLGFEKATSADSVRSRHHARFWKTGYRTADGALYVVTASLDTGIKWGITHAIAPDIDTERGVLVQDLQSTGLVTATQTLDHFVSPILGKNSTGDQYFTDGGAEFLTLRCF